ncbi:hypothetical protein DPEC_G00183720 [Dallia pectoralis]|uniref:Uncharacterized protein n=1 Tax=Dallia pectoralis TaxID=75939 RepID=A0ACC2GAR2_DALPE|nr:hypothetical protein DPEC_G00183720 [Dallia pectoralis]
MAHAGTNNSIYIKLSGGDGESDWTCIDKPAFCESVIEYQVPCPSPLGLLEFVALETKPNYLLPFINDDWFCSKVLVTTPEGSRRLFPCYNWLSGYERLVYREASGMLIFNETIPKALTEREEELKIRCEAYPWSIYADGLPYTIKGKQVSELPDEVRFSFTKDMEFKFTAIAGCHKTNTYEYVEKNWKKDEFFGYQFLNGTNPMMIKRCTELPENFPVTEDMVKDSLSEKSLQEEMQLKQEPSEDNPIFLPTDSEYDWLLAKIFVKNADFAEHEVNFHLLRTHLLAEVFAVSTLRNLPMVHPVYKLLISHFRYTLQINILARETLISETGALTLNAGIGGPGLMQLLKKAMAELTYSSLCMPEDITARGLDTVPNFYYRDDGLKLWDIINRFVESVIGRYYTSDSHVQKDSELQNWISDIFVKGFLSNFSTGIPNSFSSVKDLVKFLTMTIFTVSVQHAAVNNGQFDFVGWMPNSPLALQLPPPTTKGQSTEETMMQTFPAMNTTCNSRSVVHLLSKQSTDIVLLGDYPEQHFSEKFPLQKINECKQELKDLSKFIKVRNEKLELPYTYLDPENIETSVAL